MHTAWLLTMYSRADVDVSAHCSAAFISCLVSIFRWNRHSHAYAASIHGYSCCWWLLYWNKSSTGWRHHYDQLVFCCKVTVTVFVRRVPSQFGKICRLHVHVVLVTSLVFKSAHYFELRPSHWKWNKSTDACFLFQTCLRFYRIPWMSLKGLL